MTWMQSVPLADLQKASRHSLKLDNEDILLIWHQEAVHAIQSKCPHMKLPLLKGTITQDNEIVCPFHKSAFNIKTGKTACWSQWPPVVGKLLGKLSKEKPLQVFPTKIENDMIFLDI